MIRVSCKLRLRSYTLVCILLPFSPPMETHLILVLSFSVLLCLNPLLALVPDSSLPGASIWSFPPYEVLSYFRLVLFSLTLLPLLSAAPSHFPYIFFRITFQEFYPFFLFSISSLLLPPNIRFPFRVPMFPLPDPCRFFYLLVFSPSPPSTSLLGLFSPSSPPKPPILSLLFLHSLLSLLPFPL